MFFYWLLLEDLLLEGDSILYWLTFTREGLTLQSMSTKASCYLIELHGGATCYHGYRTISLFLSSQNFLNLTGTGKLIKHIRWSLLVLLKSDYCDYWRVSKRAFGHLGAIIWDRFITWMSSILYRLQNGYTLTYWRMKHEGQVSHGWLLLRLSITRKTVASHWFGNEPSRANLKTYIYLYTHDLECSQAKPQSDHKFVSEFNTTVCQWELLIVCCILLFGQLNDMGNRKDRWEYQMPLSWFTTNGKW